MMLKKLLCLCLCFMTVACAAPGLSQTQGDDFAVTYANDLMSGQKNQELYALFTDEVKAKLPEASFNAIWGQLTAQYGAFSSMGEVTAQEASGLQVYALPLHFEKGSLTMQLAVDGSGKVTGLFFAPLAQEETTAPDTAQLPEDVTEEDVTIGSGDWALPGTLTLPKEGAAFPAVVLVQGSGPQDRDESIGGTKLFRDIAWYLAQNGIAVLRYDKRTYAHAVQFTQEMISSITVEEETIQDAILAGQFLKEDSWIDGSKIFLLGHSLGAMLGPRILKESQGLFAGMVLASGTPLSLADIIISQNEAVLAKLDESTRKTQQPLLDAEVEKLKALGSLTPDEAKKQTLFGQPAYYFYEMLTMNQAQDVLDLQLPTLILQGGKDFQVTVENGIEAWKKALGEPAFVTYRLYPELNHLLMAYTGDPALAGSVQEYNTPANLDPQAAADIKDWILQN